MKTYFYALAFSLIAFATCQSSNLYGQSITTSEQAKSDSLQELEEFYSNANAILDSLMRYEIAKLRIIQLSNQRTSWGTERLGLKADIYQLREENVKQQQAYTVLEIKYAKTRKKLTWANIERWGWRALALTAAYLSIRQIPPL